MAKRKNQSKSKFLQEQLDNKDYTLNFNFIDKYKGIDSTHKRVYNLMCNDVFMNGSVTWKQSTYADKLGLSRQQMSNIFHLFEDKGILIASRNNKAGAKNNTYQLTVRLEKLVKKKKGFKKESSKVKEDEQTCKLGCTDLSTGVYKPVNWDVQTCKPQFTYNTSNTDNTCNTESEDSSFKEESSDKGPKDPEKPKLPITEETLQELLNDIK